jgi:hypothetical protein
MSDSELAAPTGYDLPRYCCGLFWSWRFGPPECPRCNGDLHTLESEIIKERRTRGAAPQGGRSFHPRNLRGFESDPLDHSPDNAGISADAENDLVSSSEDSP